MRTLAARLGSDGDSRLAVTEPPKTSLNHPYVVADPGATAPAGTWSPDRWAKTVVVIGGPAEARPPEHVAGACGSDLGRRTSFREFAGVLAGTGAVVGNTGPAHLAAAAGTPGIGLVSRPWRAEEVRLSEVDSAGADISSTRLSRRRKDDGPASSRRPGTGSARSSAAGTRC